MAALVQKTKQTGMKCRGVLRLTSSSSFIPAAVHASVNALTISFYAWPASSTCAARGVMMGSVSVTFPAFMVPVTVLIFMMTRDFPVPVSDWDFGWWASASTPTSESLSRTVA